MRDPVKMAPESRNACAINAFRVLQAIGFRTFRIKGLSHFRQSFIVAALSLSPPPWTKRYDKPLDMIVYDGRKFSLKIDYRYFDSACGNIGTFIMSVFAA